MKKIEPYKGIAAIYDEIRPSYPEKLIEDIICKTSIKLSDRLLEIGPGTGKATIQFAEKGFRIHGVELGEDMAEVFRDKCAKYPGVSIEVADFQQWDTEKEENYDMIYCAQAFHWLDKDIKYKKCHKLLKDDGFLVLFWYNANEKDTMENKIINEEVEKLIQKYSNKAANAQDKVERLAHSGVSQDYERRAEIEESGLFEIVDKIHYNEESKNSAAQYLKTRKTVPVFASILDGFHEKTIEKLEKEIKEIVNENGGHVTSELNFTLYIAKKVL